MSYTPVPVRQELWFRNFCQGLTNPRREMMKWLEKDLEDTMVLVDYGWDSSNLNPRVKNKV